MSHVDVTCVTARGSLCNAIECDYHYDVVLPGGTWFLFLQLPAEQYLTLVHQALDGCRAMTGRLRLATEWI